MAYYDSSDKQLGAASQAGGPGEFGSAVGGQAPPSALPSPLTGGQSDVAGGSSNTASNGGGGAAWTNIQAYLNANEGTSDKMNSDFSNRNQKILSDEYGKAQDYYRSQPLQTVTEAEAPSYQGPSPYQTGNEYNKLQDSVDGGYDAYKKEFYDSAAGQGLTTGQYDLQKQLDVGSGRSGSYRDQDKANVDFYGGALKDLYEAAQVPTIVNQPQEFAPDAAPAPVVRDEYPKDQFGNRYESQDPNTGARYIIR